MGTAMVILSTMALVCDPFSGAQQDDVAVTQSNQALVLKAAQLLVDSLARSHGRLRQIGQGVKLCDTAVTSSDLK